MTKPVELRLRAEEDIDAALDRYVDEGGSALAMHFIDAIERAVGQIGRHPLAGSLKYSFDLGLPELRSWPVPKFPYVIFYVVSPDRIDIWRILHARRDITNDLIRPDDPGGSVEPRE